MLKKINHTEICYFSCIEDMKKIETDPTESGNYMQSWDCVISREDFKVWRKPLEGTELYQYKSLFIRICTCTNISYYRI